MTVKITLEFNTMDEAIAAMQAVSGNARAPAPAGAAGQATATAGAAPTKTAKDKAPAAASAQAQQQGSTAATTPGGDAAAEVPDAKAVANAITVAVGRCGRDAVIALLKEYDATRGADLKPEQRQPFLTALANLPAAA